MLVVAMFQDARDHKDPRSAIHHSQQGSLMPTLPLLVRAVLLLSLLLAQFATADVWVADDKSLYKIDLATNRVALSVPAEKIKRLAIDPADNSVWSLGDKAITRRAADGRLLFERNLDALGLKEADYLALDARDGTAWIGSGKASNGNETVKRLDDAGQVTAIIAVAKK